MSEVPGFYCTYCGKGFGDDVIRLALHIAKMHDERSTRNNG